MGSGCVPTWRLCWPNGATVYPAQANGPGLREMRRDDDAPMGQRFAAREWLARWAGTAIAAIVPQGVALGWVNDWAFGPLNAGAPPTRPVLRQQPL